MKRPIYLDNGATTKLDPNVLKVMMPYLKHSYGNPSSRTHKYGWEAEEAVDTAREQVANLINADPHEIIFTSGATESNNMVLNAFLREIIVIGATEHSSIYWAFDKLYSRKVKVNCYGTASVDNLNDELSDYNASSFNKLVSIMLANNETGSIQPIKDMCEFAHEINWKFHSDMAQALGKIRIDIRHLNVDYASFSSHKIYGPKGVGAIYVKGGADGIRSFICGGKQEGGVRAGTLNVPGIVGFGEACRLSEKYLTSGIENDKCKRERLLKSLLNFLPEIIVHEAEDRLPGTLSISLPCNNMELFMALVSEHVALSFGSACMSGSPGTSHVLSAMNVPKDMLLKIIRLTVGKFNTIDDMNLAAMHIASAVKIANNGG